MFAWLRELLEIRYENNLRKLRLKEEMQDRNKFCSSCEVLKIELENSHRERRELMGRILNPIKETEREVAPEPQKLPTVRRHIPWTVKQQALEQEDRAKAIALRNAAKPDTSVEDLEKELDLATQTRENQSGTPAEGVNR
jgi:hypothetical protein